VHELADVGDDVELFEQLTPQGVGMRFPGVALAAGKLPMPRKVNAFGAKREEKRSMTLDDGRHDDDGIHAGGLELVRLRDQHTW
jgi:hypothetical protein